MRWDKSHISKWLKKINDIIALIFSFGWDLESKKHYPDTREFIIWQNFKSWEKNFKEFINYDLHILLLTFRDYEFTYKDLQENNYKNKIQEPLFYGRLHLSIIFYLYSLCKNTIKFNFLKKIHPLSKSNFNLKKTQITLKAEVNKEIKNNFKEIDNLRTWTTHPTEYYGKNEWKWRSIRSPDYYLCHNANNNYNSSNIEYPNHWLLPPLEGESTSRPISEANHNKYDLFEISMEVLKKLKSMLIK